MSYDGMVWSPLGQATGDSFFQSVTETNDYVLMVLADGTEIRIPKYPKSAATVSFDKVENQTAIFKGVVLRRTVDLKVTIYYGKNNYVSIYNNVGSVSKTEFEYNNYQMQIEGLENNTTYYYFTEIISDGNVTYSEVSTFRVGEPDPYVDWDENDKYQDEI